MKKKIVCIIILFILAGGVAKSLISDKESMQHIQKDGAIEQNLLEKNNNNDKTGEDVALEEVNQSIVVKELKLKNKIGEYNIKRGKRKTMDVIIAPKNADVSDLKWESSDKTIAEVSEDGVVTGRQEGSAEITVTAEKSGKKASVKVKVIPEHANIYKNGFYYHEITNQLKSRMDGKSYKENENIQYSDLRYISVKHYNYHGKVQTGELIVNQKIAQDTVEIFYELYKEKYPIQSMKLVDEYDADDVRSMEENNTSAFNYRTIPNKTTLSNHSYGLAIDINPRVNPYITNGGQSISPANGAEYAERDVEKCTGEYKNNMIHKDDVIYNIFISHGFSWGGEWNSSKDYQHFEKK